MKIAYKQGDDGGCFQYRQKNPHEALHRNGLAECSCVRLGDDQLAAARAYAPADIAVFPRLVGDNAVEVVEFMHKKGKKVVIDYDDDFFNVSPLSPHYRDNGIEEVTIFKDDKPMKLWEDGKAGFDIARNVKERQKAIDAISAADAITVTTPVLADLFGKYNPNTFVLPNMVNLAQWKRLPLKRQNVDEIRIGWQGGASHYEDWLLLVDVLPVIMAKYPQVRLIISGQAFTGTLARLPKDRVELQGWIETPAHPYRSAINDLDIMLIPLVENDFNRCKSNIKWVEAGALEVPCVTSAVTPYKEFATEFNGVFVANNTASWIEGISMLVEDSILRAKIGHTARQTVEVLFDIDKGCSLWGDAYAEILDMEAAA